MKSQDWNLPVGTRVRFTDTGTRTSYTGIIEEVTWVTGGGPNKARLKYVTRHNPKHPRDDMILPRHTIGWSINWELEILEERTSAPCEHKCGVYKHKGDWRCRSCNKVVRVGRGG